MQYLLIGNGRVARHFKYYLQQQGLSVLTWHRGESRNCLDDHLISATHILLLISDKAIETFIETHLLRAKEHYIIHCSGNLLTPLAYGAHPLMTFNHALYPLSIYQSIPFILDQDTPKMSKLLPGLPNPAFRIAKKDKAKYHAVCVLGGNLSCMLWQKLCQTFEQEFGLPADIVMPYLKQQMENFLVAPRQALTGPFVRNDWQTIRDNLSALVDDPFLVVYKSFLTCYYKQRGSI